MSEKLIYFNGLNGATGAPLLHPMTASQLIPWIKKSDQDEQQDVKDALHTVREKRIAAKQKGILGLIEGKDPLDVKQAGWGVIYHPQTPPEVRLALADLIAYRAGKELTYIPGESSRKFRSRHKQGPGVVNPDKLPYYLLVVGSPTEIPFRFQYGLDGEHAVGRLYFDDPADYGRYVKRVLDYEEIKSNLPRERRVAIFSPENPDDKATALSASYLAKPLADALNGKQLKSSHGAEISYLVEHMTGAAAKKPALLDLFTRTSHRPALVFTASHGLGFPNANPRQLDNQGALVCHEWPGPKVWPEGSEIPETMYLAGTDLAPDLALDGLIVFSFACYSAGTPQLEDFSHFLNQEPSELAPHPFVARLPQRLLAQGALAFIGHVERAWDYSFLWQDVGSHTDTFQSTLEAILKGVPVGHAFEYFNDRYADLARELTGSEEEGLLHQFNLGEPVDPDELVALWMAHNDARAYVLIGDPFVRIKPALMPSA
ncbi:MAG: hypothetical protein MOB07_03890 [Acidobacteria bacterium]|nr:hypothetical protein [Acidobacteriota bacterium]